MKVYQRRKPRGFTLIELMIVVTIIMILAAVAIPSMLRSRLNTNEAAAISDLRTISTSEFAFQAAQFVDANNDGQGDYGTLPQLADPEGNGNQGFISGSLGAGNKNGYTYTMNVVLGDAANLPAFQCVAVPQGPGVTGNRRFFVNTSGRIRFTNDGSVPDEGSTLVQ